MKTPGRVAPARSGVTHVRGLSGETTTAMQPYSHVSAPSLSPGVLRRLHRLDPSLRLTWHMHQLDFDTGNPILTRDGIQCAVTGDRTPGGAPIVNPSWYLWRKSDTCSHHFFVGMYPCFGDREVYGLEADVARRVDHSRLVRFVQSAIDDNNARDLKAANYDRRGRTDANKSANHDILFNGKRLMRRAKLFSGGGVTRRSDAGTVRMDRLDFIGRADETREE